MPKLFHHGNLSWAGAEGGRPQERMGGRGQCGHRGWTWRGEQWFPRNTGGKGQRTAGVSPQRRLPPLPPSPPPFPTSSFSSSCCFLSLLSPSASSLPESLFLKWSLAEIGASLKVKLYFDLFNYHVILKTNTSHPLPFLLQDDRHPKLCNYAAFYLHRALGFLSLA